MSFPTYDVQKWESLDVMSWSFGPNPTEDGIVVVVGPITKDEVPNRYLLMKSALRNSYGKSVFEIYQATTRPNNAWVQEARRRLRLAC